MSEYEDITNKLLNELLPASENPEKHDHNVKASMEITFALQRAVIPHIKDGDVAGAMESAGRVLATAVFMYWTMHCFYLNRKEGKEVMSFEPVIGYVMESFIEMAQNAVERGVVPEQMDSRTGETTSNDRSQEKLKTAMKTALPDDLRKLLSLAMIGDSVTDGDVKENVEELLYKHTFRNIARKVMSEMPKDNQMDAVQGIMQAMVRCIAWTAVATHRVAEKRGTSKVDLDQIIDKTITAIQKDAKRMANEALVRDKLLRTEAAGSA